MLHRTNATTTHSQIENRLSEVRFFFVCILNCVLRVSMCSAIAFSDHVNHRKPLQRSNRNEQLNSKSKNSFYSVGFFLLHCDVRTTKHQSKALIAMKNLHVLQIVRMRWKISRLLMQESHFEMCLQLVAVENERVSDWVSRCDGCIAFTWLRTELFVSFRARKKFLKTPKQHWKSLAVF